MRRADLASAIRVEREALVEDLSGLSEAQWDMPSLCDGWRHRDVVAHLIRVGHFYQRQYTFEWDVIRYGFRLNRAIAKRAVEMGSAMSIDELLARLSGATYEKTFVFRIHPSPSMALAEWIVHGQDIRRSLGMTRRFDEAALVAAADVSKGVRYPWGNTDHVKGVRLEATDADWAHGKGPVVRGPLEAIVMLLTGRRSALTDLEGPGVNQII